MSLFDRLKNMQKEKESVDIEQCECGSNLKDECDECDRVTDDHPVLEKIREIGDQKQVNSPKPESSNKAVKVKRGDPSGTCPICNKEFKHLSRHRCKEKQWEGIKKGMDDFYAPPKEEKVHTVNQDMREPKPVYDNLDKEPTAEMIEKDIKEALEEGAKDKNIVQKRKEEEKDDAYDLYIKSLY
jgi:hypothetical protein